MAGNVSARENALHCLGTALHPRTRTANQAMQQAKLTEWNLRKYPVYTEVEDNQLTIPGRCAVVRDSPMIAGMVEIMGEVNEGYTIIQNEDLEPLLDTLAEESGSTFVTAGELDGGRRVFVTLKLPGVAKVGGVDVVDNYITVLSGHDGETSTSLMITPVQVRSASTLNLSFQQANYVLKVKHTRGAHKILAAQAREALEFSFNYLDHFQETADRLIERELTQSRFEQLITSNFGAPKGASPSTITRTQNKLDQMAELFSDSYSLAGVGETAWAGLSALTEWHDHYSPVRVLPGMEAEQRSRNALLTPAFKNKALHVMVQA